jgi:hypothetical protein
MPFDKAGGLVIDLNDFKTYAESTKYIRQESSRSR